MDLFDDLIPSQSQSGAGLFDDLIPVPKSASFDDLVPRRSPQDIASKRTSLSSQTAEEERGAFPGQLVEAAATGGENLLGAIATNLRRIPTAIPRAAHAIGSALGMTSDPYSDVFEPNPELATFTKPGISPESRPIISGDLITPPAQGQGPITKALMGVSQAGLDVAGGLVADPAMLIAVPAAGTTAGGAILQSIIGGQMAGHFPEAAAESGRAAAEIERGIIEGEDPEIVAPFTRSIANTAATGAFAGGPLARGAMPLMPERAPTKTFKADMEAYNAWQRAQMSPPVPRIQKEAPNETARSGQDSGTIRAESGQNHGEGKPAEQMQETRPVVQETQAALVGMGGAVESEFKPNPSTPTSIKNETVAGERAKREFPEAVQAARKGFGTVWDNAMARIDREPYWQDRLMDELREKPRALTDEEDAALLHRQIDLQNEYGRLNREIASAFEDGRGAALDAAKAQRDIISDQLKDIYDIGKAAGTETGRGLNARKMMAMEDFSLAKMELDARAARGGRKLTDKERSELEAAHKRIADLEAKLTERETAIADSESGRRAMQAIIDLQKEQLGKPQFSDAVVNMANKIVQYWETRADAAKARLREKLSKIGTTPDPTIILDLAEIGGYYIAKGVKDLAEFSAQATKEFGESVKPWLEEAWKRAQIEFAKTEDRISGPFKETVRKASERKVVSAAEKEARKAKLQSEKLSGEDLSPEELSTIARDLARDYIENGMKDRDAIVKAVHRDIEGERPGTTLREVQDAISLYGKFKQLSKDEVSVKLREVAGELQQLAKLEDIQKGKPPLKTGIERREPSAEESRLIQQVNEAKKKYGIVTTDPAKQLKSALDSAKKRLKTQIADYEQQIKTKTKIVDTRTPLKLDVEAESLKVKRDALKKEFDDIFNTKRELTDAQRVKLAMGAVERSIADLEQRIKTGDIARTARLSKTPETPAIEAARARRDALREQLQEMRDLVESPRNIQAEKAALEKSIAEKQAKLASGDIAPEKKEISRPDMPELEPLKQQRDALNKQLADARKKPEAQKYAESLQRQIERLNKTIAEREAHVAAGTKPEAKKLPVNRPASSPELEQAKQRLAEINKQLEGPPRTEEEIARQRYKTMLANRIADYKERLAAGDFGKPQKKFDFSEDKEFISIKAELEKTKNEYKRQLRIEELKNRTTGQKVVAGAKEALNLPRTVMSSWDLSAVARQGGLIGIGNPARAARSIGPMLRALVSEKASREIEQQIQLRPNAPLYARSKLYLAKLDEIQLSKKEEQIMSSLADKIPGIRPSNRAFVTYLNKLRADSFDAMVDSLGSKPKPEELNAIANYINIATGRGDLGRLNAAAEGLATMFFSPRLTASRFQILAGQPLYKGSSKTRTLIAKEYAKTLLGLAAIYGLGQMAGGTVETDPRSSDFGKIKFGNTRVDPMMGLSQSTVLLSREASGETKSLKGKVRPIRGPDTKFGDRTGAEVAGAFLRSKLAPVPGAIVDLASGKNVVGEPVDAKSIAENMLIPLTFQDIAKVMEEQGMERGTAIELLNLLGMSVQHFDANKKPNGKTP